MAALFAGKFFFLKPVSIVISTNAAQSSNISGGPTLHFQLITAACSASLVTAKRLKVSWLLHINDSGLEENDPLQYLSPTAEQKTRFHCRASKFFTSD